MRGAVSQSLRIAQHFQNVCYVRKVIAEATPGLDTTKMQKARPLCRIVSSPLSPIAVGNMRTEPTVLGPNWAKTTLGAVLALVILSTGCKKPDEEEKDPVKRREAQLFAQREAAKTYLKNDGSVDWQKRVKAANEELEKAESDRRWGRHEQALEHALEAARLMPPNSKDFDAASSDAASSDAASSDGRSDGSGSGSEQPTKGNAQPGGKDQPGGKGNQSSNEQGASGGLQGGGNSNAQGGGRAGQPAGGGRSPSGGTASAGDSTGGSTTNGGGSEGGVTNEEVAQLRAQLDAMLQSLDGKAGSAGANLNMVEDAIEIR